MVHGIGRPRSTSDGRGWVFAVDRGGTFTDLLAIDPLGRRRSHKVLSDVGTGEDGIGRAIRQAVRHLGRDRVRIDAVLLGTTVATNALVQRRGASVALAVNEGFEDLLNIGDARRPDLFGPATARPAGLYDSVVAVTGRIAADGSEHVAIDPKRCAPGSAPPEVMESKAWPFACCTPCAIPRTNWRWPTSPATADSTGWCVRTR